MHTLFRISLLTLSILAFVGCDAQSESVPPPTITPTEAIKNDLQYIVEHQTVGSEMMTIQDNINKLKETEPEKAAKLQEEYRILDKAPRSQAAAQAKKMIGLL